MKAHLVIVIVSLGRGEHQEVRLHLAGENLLCGLVVEINNQGERLRTDELGNLIRRQLNEIRYDEQTFYQGKTYILSQDGLAIIECLQNNHPFS